MIPRDFELHERNIRLFRNKREGIIVRRWIKYNAPEFTDYFDKIGCGSHGGRKFLLEKAVGE